MTYLIETYSKLPLTLVKGQGSYVWDKKGQRYLDFYGGHAVCIIGHSPKKVASAISQQSKKLFFYSNIVTTEPQNELAKKLAGTLGDYKVYFSNSGSEANETAIKIARKFSGKKHLVAFTNSFHGRSITNLAVTGIPSYHQFNPSLDQYTSFAKMGDMDSVKKACNKNTAAIICEPIQSIGGIIMANKKFYQELAKFCKQKNILLIFDEIQTGLKRTGNFWFADSVGIKPDIVTCAKGLASGLPIGATIVKAAIAKTIKASEHGTTFGGGPVVCSAAIATLKEIQKIKGITGKFFHIKKTLEKNPAIAKVHGQGLLIGIETNKTQPHLIQRCLQNNLIIGSSNRQNVFRIMPPLNVTKQEIDQFLRIFLSQLA